MDETDPGRKRRNPAYTRADLQRWKTDMLLKRPVARHVEGKVQGVSLTAFDVRPSANGMHILVATGRGEEVMILLNPVLAAALRDGITKCGQEGNWLEDDGTIVVPDE